MGAENRKIRLYTSQSKVVVKLLQEQKVCNVKREYIVNKYEEVSHIFLEAYDWYISKAVNFVDRPQGAGYPYWAFTDSEYAGWSPDCTMLALDIPINEAVFFKIKDWYNILNLCYLPKDEKDQESFDKLLNNYNIKNNMDIFTTPYYPDMKRKVKNSWDNLFKYHSGIVDGTMDMQYVQAGLWQLKLEWVVDSKQF